VVSENHAAQNTNEIKSQYVYAAKNAEAAEKKDPSLKKLSYILKAISWLFPKKKRAKACSEANFRSEEKGEDTNKMQRQYNWTNKNVFWAVGFTCATA